MPAPYSDHTFALHRHQQPQLQRQEEGRPGGIVEVEEGACGLAMESGWLGGRFVKGVKRMSLPMDWESGEEKKG